MTDREDWRPQENYGQQYTQQPPWEPQQYDPQQHAQRLAQAPSMDAHSAPAGQTWPMPPSRQQTYAEPPPFNPTPAATGYPAQPPQPPQSPPRQQRARSPRRRTLVTAAITAGALILGIIIGSAGSSGKSSAASPAPTATVTVTATATATAAHSKASPAKAPAPASKAPASTTTSVVATFSGSGIKNTPTFTVSATWKLDYTYDCADAGGSGNFIVDEDGGNDMTGASVNELGASGSSSTWVYNDAGTHYLEVDSECSWTMKIVDEG
jgi:hypothetical protein